MIRYGIHSHMEKNDRLKFQLPCNFITVMSKNECRKYSALRPWAYISGKSLVPMLQLFTCNNFIPQIKGKCHCINVILHWHWHWNLDEVHRVSELFCSLRGCIDRSQQKGPAKKLVYETHPSRNTTNKIPIQ